MPKPSSSLEKKTKTIRADSEAQFVEDLTNLFHVINDPENDVIRRWLGPDVIHSLKLPEDNSTIYIVIPIARCYGISLDALDDCSRNVVDGKCAYSSQGFKFFCEMIHANEKSARNVDFVAMNDLIASRRYAQRRAAREEFEEEERADVSAGTVTVVIDNDIKEEEDVKDGNIDRMTHYKLFQSAFGFLDAFTIGLRCCTHADCDILSELEDAFESSISSHRCISDGSSVPDTGTIRILGEFFMQMIHCLKSLELCNGAEAAFFMKKKFKNSLKSSFGGILREERYAAAATSSRGPSEKRDEYYLSKHLAEAYRFVVPYLGIDPTYHSHARRIKSVIADVEQTRATMSDYARHMFGYGHPAISQTLGKALDSLNLPERAKFLGVFGAPNFYLSTLNNEDSDVRFHVHDWLLLARWPIISNMIKCGFEESQKRELILSEDITSTMLRAIVQCIYHPQFDPPYIFTPQIDVELLEEYRLTKFKPLLPKSVISDDNEDRDSDSSD